MPAKPKLTVFNYDSRDFLFLGAKQVANNDPLTVEEVLGVLEEAGILEFEYFGIDDMVNDEVDYPEDNDTVKSLKKKWGIK